MTQVTKKLSEFTTGLRFDALPRDLDERTGMLIKDSVGNALRARNDAESTDSLIRAAAKLGLDKGSSVCIGDRRGFSPPGAALVNGTLIHSLDFDDTHARGSLHPSGPIVPAALAAAEMAGVDGEELIPAIIAGYETQIRLSLALGPSDHYDRGYHPTATCGAFGAAAAAGKVFCLDADQMANAFGICLSQTSGTMQFLIDGAWTKRFQIGQAAMNGLIAATLAKEGFKGSVEAFEGKYGFFHSYAPDAQPEKATEGLGAVWETMQTAVKPYPSCRYSHAAMDALIDLRAANDIQPDDIDSIEIGLPETGWKIIGDPEEAKQNPKSVVDGQFSMAFCAAVVLRQGGLVWDDYAAHISDQKTLDLCRKVTCVTDAKPQALFPDKMSAIARVRTAKGEYEAFIGSAKGEPDNFLSGAELRAKFDGLVGPYLPPSRIDELASRLLAIDKEDDINEVLRLSRPVRPELQAAGE